jgi:hypothetical protein
MFGPNPQRNTSPSINNTLTVQRVLGDVAGGWVGVGGGCLHSATCQLKKFVGSAWLGEGLYTNLTAGTDPNQVMFSGDPA